MILKINDVDLPVSVAPDGYKCEILDLDYNNSSSFGRAINGEITRNRIAVKRKLTLKFNAIRSDHLATIITMMEDEFFNVYYFDSKTGGYETKTFYVGDRPANSVATQLSSDTVIYWNGFTVKLTEK